jgi:hypothetical protein
MVPQESEQETKSISVSVKTVSKKKSRRTIQRESLSSLGKIEEIEHVYLSAMTFDMLDPLLDESSDQSASEADETMIETATMSAS